MEGRRVTIHSIVSNLGFDHLETLRAVAETGSFRGAANLLRLSQPAVSQRIRAMERVLGASLLDRQRGMSSRLTPLGERTLKLAEAVLAELNTFHGELPNFSGVQENLLTVTAGPAFIQYRLLPAVKQFSSRYPAVDVRLQHSTSSAAVLEAVLKGRADVGFYTEPPPRQRVHAQMVSTDELVLVAAPGHKALELSPTELSEQLERFGLAVSSATASSRRLLQTWADQHGVAFRVKLEADNLDTLKEAALTAFALGFLPAFAVEEELATGKLQRIDVPGLPVERAVWAITRLGVGREESLRATKLIGHVSQLLDSG